MRTRLQKRIIKGAKETLKTFHKEHESSEYAQALQMKDFALKPMFEKKDLKLQLNEIRGKIPFDKNQYHSARYNDLMKRVVNLRVEYFKCHDKAGREQIAKEDFDHWYSFLIGRREDLPKPDWEFPLKDFLNLKETFDRHKDRKTHRLQGDKVVEMHGDYGKKFKMSIPVHPRNLEQMIHPHVGYCTGFKDGISWDEMHELYKNQIVSSYERTLGFELFADELSCLSFWLIVDQEKKGYMSLQKFEKLLQGFRFDI